MEAFLADRERRFQQNGGYHSSDEESDPGLPTTPRFPTFRCCEKWPHDRKWQGCRQPLEYNPFRIGPPIPVRTSGPPVVAGESSSYI